jgi:transcription initiation factor TFIID subunit 15
MGERLVVQFARGARRNDQAPHPYQERSAPRPRRTPFRMQISNLLPETSWQVSTIPPIHSCHVKSDH